MSAALLKNMHVHFDDEVLSESATKQIMDDEMDGDRKAIVAPLLNYTREKLLEFGQSKASKEPPKMFDLSGADGKRMEKIRHVLKNNDIWKTWKNGVADDAFASKGGVTEAGTSHRDQARTSFQQMISDAVSNAQQQNGDYATAMNQRQQRRIGSGRIPDQNFTAQDNIYAIGMDARYMRNKLFKEDGKVVKNWKSANDMHWNTKGMATQASDIDNADAKSDEPEWANCGPISKHDIIELHGFDGPEEDDSSKNESAMPAQRNSTPSKSSQKKTVKDDHFNFEEFLKLDLPPSVNCSRDLGAGESRFSQWFGRDKLSHANGKFTGNGYDGKTTQQFFDYHQKANQKKLNASNKLRSVNELEADWCPISHQPKVKEQKLPSVQQPDINAIRMMLNQLAAAIPAQVQAQAQAQAQAQVQRATMNSAQSNFLLSLINKGAENLYQYRLSQNAIMERPDAQLLLHRLVNGEITQFHILQQINNPTIHQRDRETLLAVFAFWNENQQRLVQQQNQQMKYKEQMSQQLRQLQMMKNGGQMMQPPTPQELQLHTQNIMQNAMYKKQFEDQYRSLHNLKMGHQTKYQSYKSNNNFMAGQGYNNNRSNYKQQKPTQFGQNGLQFIQNKSLWNRPNQTNANGNFPLMTGGAMGNGMRNTNDLFAATMPTFAKFDSPTMANDKVPISVEK